MSHTPKNRVIVFRRAKHHTPVFLYNEACGSDNSFSRVGCSCGSDIAGQLLIVGLSDMF